MREPRLRFAATHESRNALRAADGGAARCFERAGEREGRRLSARSSSGGRPARGARARRDRSWDDRRSRRNRRVRRQGRRAASRSHRAGAERPARSAHSSRHRRSSSTTRSRRCSASRWRRSGVRRRDRRSMRALPSPASAVTAACHELARHRHRRARRFRRGLSSRRLRARGNRRALRGTADGSPVLLDVTLPLSASRLRCRRSSLRFLRPTASSR